MSDVDDQRKDEPEVPAEVTPAAEETPAAEAAAPEAEPAAAESRRAGRGARRSRSCRPRSPPLAEARD